MHSSPPHIHTTTHSKPLANASRSLHPHGYTTSNYSLVHKPHPAANRQTGGAGGGAEQLSSHTQGPGEREQRRAARALSQGLLLGLGSRPIRARVTREGQGLLGLGLLGLGLLGLGLIGLGLGSGTGLGLGLGLWLGLVMLIALTTLVTRARVRVRGLLGIGLGLSRLGLRPLQSQALPVSPAPARSEAPFWPSQGTWSRFGVGESRRWPILRVFGSLYTSLLGSL